MSLVSNHLEDGICDRNTAIKINDRVNGHGTDQIRGGHAKRPPDQNGLFPAARFRLKYTSGGFSIPMTEINIPVGTAVHFKPDKVVGARKVGLPVEMRSAIPLNNQALLSQEDLLSKKVSFATIVLKSTNQQSGHRYYADIVGTQARRKTLESEALVYLYKIHVKQNGEQWVIYRRYKQFKICDILLKRKQILPSNDKHFPYKTLEGFKSKPDQLKKRFNELSCYLQFLLDQNTVNASHYFGNFLEPVNMGDSKKESI